MTGPRLVPAGASVGPEAAPPAVRGTGAGIAGPAASDPAFEDALRQAAGVRSRSEPGRERAPEGTAEQASRSTAKRQPARRMRPSRARSASDGAVASAAAPVVAPHVADPRASGASGGRAVRQARPAVASGAEGATLISSGASPAAVMGQGAQTTASSALPVGTAARTAESRALGSSMSVASTGPGAAPVAGAAPAVAAAPLIAGGGSGRGGLGMPAAPASLAATSGTPSDWGGLEPVVRGGTTVGAASSLSSTGASPVDGAARPFDSRPGVAAPAAAFVVGAAASTMPGAAAGSSAFDAIMAVAGLDRAAPSFAGAGLLAAAPAARRVRAPVSPPTPGVGDGDVRSPRARPRVGAPPGADAPRAPMLDPGRYDVDAVRPGGPLSVGAELAVARGADILAPLEVASAADAPGAEPATAPSSPGSDRAAEGSSAPVVEPPVLVGAAPVGATPAVAQVTSAVGGGAVGVSASDAAEVVATLAERVDAAAVLPESVDVAVTDPLGDWGMSLRRGADGFDVALSGDRAFTAALEGVEQDLRRALGAVGHELRAVSVREDRASVAPAASASSSSMPTAGGGTAQDGREPAPSRVADVPVSGARNKGATGGPSAPGGAEPVIPRRGVLLDRTA